MSSHLMSGGRYPGLRSLALLYMIGAAIAVVAGVGGVIWALGWAPDTMSHRLVLAAGVLAATFFVVISMLAIAEVIKLFMDIEHNSRLARFADSNAGFAASSVGVSAGANRLAQLDE